MKKLLMVIFTENMSIGASMLAAQAQKHGWLPDIYYIPEFNGQQNFTEYLYNNKPDLVAVSFKSYERNQAFEAAEISSSQGIKTIAGGIHATFLPEDVKQCESFDAIVVGDGMGVFCEILDRYEQLSGGEIIHGREHPDKEKYLEYFYSDSMASRLQKTKSILFLSAFGCPYECAFCCSGRVPFYSYPIPSVVKSMYRLNQEYGVTNFQVNDEVFASSAARIKAFRKECLKYFPAGVGLSSFVSARANTFSEEIAKELVDLGVTTVGFGIETPSPKLLTFLNKRQTEDDCYRAIKICKKYGLVSSINLLFGLPTQDKEDYESAYEFIVKAAPDKCSLYYYSPYPGTDLYDYCFDNNLFEDGIVRDNFDWFDPKDDGVMKIQYHLAGVDYDLARFYMEKIRDVMTAKAMVMEKISLIDRKPWILIGMSNHYYFKSLLSKIVDRECVNFCGYIDLNDMGSYPVDKNIPTYQSDSQNEPEIVATYCFMGGGDYSTVKDYVSKKFSSSNLVSIASYRSNSLDEIQEIVGG